jgi:hypothetical protein
MCTTGITNTGGKFGSDTASVVDAGGKFATGVNDTAWEQYQTVDTLK